MIYEFAYQGKTHLVELKEGRLVSFPGQSERGVETVLRFAQDLRPSLRSGSTTGVSTYEIDYTPDGRLLVRNGATLKEIHAVVSGDNTFVDIDGILYEFAVPSQDVNGAGGGGSAMTDPSKVLAPMPGKVVKILVKVGDPVEPKQHLVIVEAMKMENIIVAHGKGKVKAIHFSEGAQVDTEHPIVELELE